MPGAPRRLNQQRDGRSEARGTLILRPVPPFRLDLTVWALRRRARNAIDRWDGRTYRRVVILGGRPTELAVRQERLSTAPRLMVTVTPSFETEVDAKRLRTTIDRLLGLRVDLTQWHRTAARGRPHRQGRRGAR